MLATPPKTERNQELYKRWKSGESRFDLIKEYGISMARFYVIVNMVQKRMMRIDTVEANSVA